jgi:hypothetical protein
VQSALLLALFLVVAFGPLVAPVSSQPASRIALTAAIAEHHTVDISGYPLGIDRAHYNGHLRSDKAPGQPLLAVPVYDVGRALGMQSVAHLRQNANLTAWWVTFWTSFLPWVALVVLMYLVACRYAPPIPAFAAAVGLGVCSMLLPHAVNLYGAALAALTAYGAWAVLDAGALTPARLAGAGVLAGACVVMEYETGIVLAVLAVFVLYRARRRAAWFALGAIGPLLLGGLYQTLAFGKPWRTAHAYYATAAIREQIVGYQISWQGVRATFYGPHSLLLTNGVVLVGLAAAVMVARSRNLIERRHAVMALAVAVPYLVLCVVWKGTPALEEPGPRYMIPALPFLTVPLAVAWPKIRRIALVAIALSAIVAIGATTTHLLAAKNEQVLPAMIRRVVHLDFLPTLWSMGFGRLGIVIYVVTVVGCGAALTMQLRRLAEPSREHRTDVRSAVGEPLR